MGKKGDAHQPQYELSNGIVLDLNPVRGLVLNRYLIEWEKLNPPPKPLPYLRADGVWKEADFDPSYIDMKAVYDRMSMDYQTGLIFKMGIKTPTPSDWTPEHDIFADDVRLNWLYTIIPDEDIQDLSNAIMGIANATQAGLDAAQKN